MIYRTITIPMAPAAPSQTVGASWGILGQFSSSKMGFHGPWDGRLTRSPKIFPDADGCDFDGFGWFLGG